MENGIKINGRAEHTSQRLRLIVVGCGIGGLACAIASAREGLSVLMLEKLEEHTELGAGIGLQPNAMRLMERFGLVDKIEAAGGRSMQHTRVFDYTSGEILTIRPAPEQDGEQWHRDHYGQAHYTIHRRAYLRVLLDEAERLSVEIRLGCNVVGVNFEKPSVYLQNGEEIVADAVVGADGIGSSMRTQVLGYTRHTYATGDLAYRATIPMAKIKASNDRRLDGFLTDGVFWVWWGPGAHVFMYPVQSGTILNMAFLCPDDLPSDVRKMAADKMQLRQLFKDWDPRLHALLDQTVHVLKWKLEHIEELETWVKGPVALLGDACHPSLPYLGQGAAMAAEDGACIGTLLGLVQRSSNGPSIASAFVLYEQLRKKRTTNTVRGATDCQIMFHLSDKDEIQERNRILKGQTWNGNEDDFPWLWANSKYQGAILSFDVIQDTKEAFASEFGTVDPTD